MHIISDNQNLTQPVASPVDIHTKRTDVSVPRITEEGQVEQVTVEITQVSGYVVYEHH